MSQEHPMRPWLVCLSAAMFFCYEFFQVNMFNALAPELIKTFDTNGTVLSLLSSLYFYGNVLLLVPAGILLDKLSTRKLILLAMALSIIGTTIFALSTSLFMAAFGRFLVGVSGGPFCLLSTLRLASRWFPENRLAFVTGLIVAIGMLGGILSQTPLAILIDGLGWRQAILMDVFGGLLILFLLYLVIQDYPKDKKAQLMEQEALFKQRGFVQGLKVVVLKYQNWYCGIFASLLNLPIFLLGALVGGLYLTQTFGISAIEASLVTSMLYIGMLIGSPFFGWISDKVGVRKPPMTLGLLLCLGAILIVMESTHLSVNSLLILFLLIGFGSSSQILAYPMVAESNPLALTGSSEGLAATLIMSGGAIFQPVIGWLMELHWDGQISQGVPLYSSQNFHEAMLLFPISLAISLLMILCMKETYCNRETVGNLSHSDNIKLRMASEKL